MPKEIRDDHIEKLQEGLTYEGYDLLIRILMRTGMRSQELYKIQSKDIHEGQLLVRACKGSLDVHKPILDLERPLKAFLGDSQSMADALTQSSATSFTSCLRRHWQKRLIKILGIGGPHYSLHDFRATGAMRVYRATKDVEMVRRWLGHKSYSSVHRYISVIQAADWAKFAI